MSAPNRSVESGTVRSGKDRSCCTKGSETSARIVKTEAQNAHPAPPLRCENASLGLRRRRMMRFKAPSGPRLASSKIWMSCIRCGAVPKYSHLSCDMHAATESMRLAFEIVARVEITECQEDSGFSFTIHSVMTIAIKHAQLKSMLPSSHHHQSLSASHQAPSFRFSGDKLKRSSFGPEFLDF